MKNSQGVRHGRRRGSSSPGAVLAAVEHRARTAPRGSASAGRHHRRPAVPSVVHRIEVNHRAGAAAACGPPPAPRRRTGPPADRAYVPSAGGPSPGRSAAGRRGSGQVERGGGGLRHGGRHTSIPRAKRPTGCGKGRSGDDPLRPISSRRSPAPESPDGPRRPPRSSPPVSPAAVPESSRPGDAPTGVVLVMADDLGFAQVGYPIGPRDEPHPVLSDASPQRHGRRTGCGWDGFRSAAFTCSPTPGQRADRPHQRPHPAWRSTATRSTPNEITLAQLAAATPGTATGTPRQMAPRRPPRAGAVPILKDDPLGPGPFGFDDLAERDELF